MVSYMTSVQSSKVATRNRVSMEMLMLPQSSGLMRLKNRLPIAA